MTHKVQILQPGSGTTPPTTSASAVSSLSGLIGQVAAMSGAGLGTPGVNALGTQINTMAGQITGTGSSFASTIAGLGTTMSTAIQSAIPALVTSMQSALTSLMSALGSATQIIHSHTIDANLGHILSAFNGQHSTTINSNGVTHSSTANVTLTAPNLPFNGAGLFSNTVVATQGMTATAFTVSSDERLKSDIRDIDPMLDRLMTTEVKRFHKKGIAYDKDANQSIHEDGVESFGFIAQKLKQTFPELVHGDEAKEFLSVNEGGVAIVTWVSLQEFVREMRAEIAELKKRLGE